MTKNLNMNLNRSPLGFGHSRCETFYNREAFDFTLGKILGDGHINKKNQLEIDQKIEEYTIWNQGETRRLLLSSEEATVTSVKRRLLDKETFEYTYSKSYRCYSRAYFREFRKSFYKEKTPNDPTYGRGSKYRKCYPEELSNWLTSPYSLAVFYMDDGGIQGASGSAFSPMRKGGSAFFATGEVSTEEVLFLKEILKNNFDLNFVPLKASENIRAKSANNTLIYKGLYLKHECRADFFHFIAPTVLEVPSMRYKLDFIQRQI